MIDRSIKNKKKMEKHMKQKWKMRNISSITVLNFIQLQKLDLSDLFFNQLSKLQRFPVVYITIYRKKKDKTGYFGDFFMVRKRTNRKHFEL